MKKKTINIIIGIFVLTIFLFIFVQKTYYQPFQVGGINEKYIPPKYNPNKSITYNKPYEDVEKELLYARITTTDNTRKDGRKTIRLLREKSRLIEIIKGFDKIKSLKPNEKYPTRLESKNNYNLVIWRKNPVVFVILESKEGDFYYEESDHLYKRKMPKDLVKLLGF